MEYEDYLERIDKVIVRENHNIGLGFKDGYVFFRTTHRETFPLLYDLFAEISDFAGAGTTEMTAAQYITAKELKSDTLSASNIFKVTEKDHLYQLFYGFSPSVLKVFPAYPRETEINHLEVGLHTSSYTTFGFLDGFESPINKPSPRSQVFVPYGPLIGFAFHNYAPYSIKPMMRFIVNRLKVATIKDPDLIMKILQRRVECTFATIGGLGSPWGTSKANYEDWWKVQPIDLLATREEVASAVRR